MGLGLGAAYAPSGEEVERGGVAQLGERLLCTQEVVGSIPVASTILPCP